jgi:2,3,4,5-tetrahydropyridine-2-carboxylate N-succinyltransferase
VTTHLAGTELLEALEEGRLRVAERASDGTWQVHAWIKTAILKMFSESDAWPQTWPRVDVGDEELRITGKRNVATYPSSFVDKYPFTPRSFTAAHKVRIVPGGTSVRRGAHLGRGVVCMPPSYVNVGAYVGEGTMIDSHALVGSCAQIGKHVHLSAGAQIGGVLEPAGARPVIVEDDAFIGGNTGLYEGVLVRKGAVIAAGVVLAGSTVVFDVVNECELRGTREAPLEIPERAVVVPGTRPITKDGVANGWAMRRGVQIACGVIVKYRDEKTDRSTALEQSLR